MQSAIPAYATFLKVQIPGEVQGATERLKEVHGTRIQCAYNALTGRL